MENAKRFLKEGKITKLQYDLLLQVQEATADVEPNEPDDMSRREDVELDRQELPAPAGELSERQFLGNVEVLMNLDLIDSDLFYLVFNYNEDSLGEVAGYELHEFAERLHQDGFALREHHITGNMGFTDSNLAEPELWESPDGDLFIVQHDDLAFQVFKLTKLGEGETSEDFQKILSGKGLQQIRAQAG